MPTTPQNENSLLTFPSQFTLKVFGYASPQFEIETLTILRAHIPDFSDQVLHLRQSANGKYIALSVTFTAESREQLDRLYLALSTSPHILMAI